jgi:uncharacterized protein (TIGR02594 family)
MRITLYHLAQRFIGQVVELPGEDHSPFIQWCHESCGFGPNTPDEVPWCSSFLNRIAWMLRCPRSKSAMARSWLEVGEPVTNEPVIGWDVVVLQRGGGDQPGPDVLDAPGHVGLFAGFNSFTDRGGNARNQILVLGGNQSNAVSIRPYPLERVLGVRRLADPFLP